MKDDIRKGFEEAVAKSRARDTAAKQASQEEADERQRFQTDYRQLAEKVIMPALEEVAREFMRPAGWTCQVDCLEEADSEVRLHVFRGDMGTPAGPGVRPHLDFSPDRHAPTISIYRATRSESDTEGSYALKEITPDFVQEQALRFFNRLLVEGR